MRHLSDLMLSDPWSFFAFPFFCIPGFSAPITSSPHPHCSSRPIHLPRRRIFSLRHQRCFSLRSLVLTTNFHDRSCDMGDSREFLGGEKTGSPRYPLKSYKTVQFSFESNLIRIPCFLVVCLEPNILCMHRMLVRPLGLRCYTNRMLKWLLHSPTIRACDL